MRDNKIGDKGADAIADYLELGQLQELDIRGNIFSSKESELRLGEESWRLDVLNGMAIYNVSCEARPDEVTLSIVDRPLRDYEVEYLKEQLSTDRAHTEQIVIKDAGLSEKHFTQLTKGITRQAAAVQDKSVDFERVVKGISLNGANQLQDVASKQLRFVLDPKTKVRPPPQPSMHV